MELIVCSAISSFSSEFWNLNSFLRMSLAVFSFKDSRSSSSIIKESLRKRTSEAYEKGIFGAPTFVSNNKIFWGQDRLEFVLKESSK